MDLADPPRPPPPIVIVHQEPVASGMPAAGGHEDPSAAADDDGPALEVGAGAFFLVGAAAGSYAGVAPFLVHEIGDGVFVRPSVALGQSLATNLRSTWAAARLDTCTRLPGRYAARNGIQLDLCAGPDIGFSYVAAGNLPGAPGEAQTLPYIDVGPMVGMRAEAGRWAFGLRAGAAVNVARGGYTDVTGARVDVAPFAFRLELALSWDAPLGRRAGAMPGETIVPR